MLSVKAAHLTMLRVDQEFPESATGHTWLQRYLAHKKQPPPRGSGGGLFGLDQLMWARAHGARTYLAEFVFDSSVCASTSFSPLEVAHLSLLTSAVSGRTYLALAAERMVDGCDHVEGESVLNV